MKHIRYILLVILVSVSYAQGVDDKIKQICGTNPVISYLKDFKIILMNSEILVHAEKCAKGEVDTSVWKWQLADVDLKGCLTKKYGYQKSYVDTIANQFNEAYEIVFNQIAPFNTCVTNVRNCGIHPCKDNNHLKINIDNRSVKENTDIICNGSLDIPIDCPL